MYLASDGFIETMIVSLLQSTLVPRFLVPSRTQVLVHQALTVHHTSPGFIRLRGRSTYGYNRSSDLPARYINQSSSRRAYWLDSRPTVEDNQAMDRLA
jgi:hypothetical protein